MVIIIAAMPVVLSAGSTFSGEKLKSACSSYIYKYTGQDAVVDFAAEISDQYFDKSKVTARCTGQPESFRGLCYVYVEFRLNGRLLKRLNIPVRVKIYREVAVAGESLPSGSKIKGSDINYKKVDITHYSSNELPEYDDIIGSTLVTSLPKGAVIVKSSLGGDVLVRRGDKVTVVASSGAVNVRASGFAMQDASAGEPVKVKCNGSILRGRVAMDGTIFLSDR